MSLEIYIGPMYAGKTSKLIQLYKESRNSIVIDYNIEDDTNDIIITKLYNHNNAYIEHVYKTKHLSKLYHIECYKDPNDYHSFLSANTIFINECQFFPDLKNHVLYLLKEGIHIKLFGLDGDFKQNPFGETFALIPYCNHLEKLTGKCNNCKHKSILSHRLCKDTNIYLTDSNQYIPLCLSCYRL